MSAHDLNKAERGALALLAKGWTLDTRVWPEVARLVELGFARVIGVHPESDVRNVKVTPEGRRLAGTGSYLEALAHG